MQAEPLTDRSVEAIVKRYVELAYLDPAGFAGHSLWAGFITSAAGSGASLLRIANQSRYKSLDVLRGYVRRADMFKDQRVRDVPLGWGAMRTTSRGARLIAAARSGKSVQLNSGTLLR